jgi:phospholipid-binding lipoprotein MlaA
MVPVPAKRIEGALPSHAVTVGKKGAVMALLLACACSGWAQKLPDPRDPFESLNRAVFTLNDALDRVLIKPVATVYGKVTPYWARKGVGNFFGNLVDVWSVVNNAAALKGKATSDSLGRVMVNSTVGILGLIDVASDLDIEKHPADFGLTLGRWGIRPGPYVVLPILGPFTLREIVALPVDYYGNLTNHIDDKSTREVLTVVNAIDVREGYLKAGEVIDAAALDAYSFTRDSYFQRQRYREYDGDVPESPEIAPEAP